MNFTFLKKLIVMAAVALAFTLQSCSDDPEPPAPGQAGFFVVNEGGFGNGNTSLSYYDRKTGTMTNDVFAQKNGRPLGDQAQSMTIIGDKGYIVVQGSNKIEVINVDDFSSVATIQGTTGNELNPRYILAVSATKAYVSDWGSDYMTGTIKILDLSTNKITGTIANVGVGSNRMIRVGSNVFVTNSGGYMTPDNQITVINSSQDVIADRFTVADNTNSLVVDKDANLWVAATGNVIYNDDYSINESKSTPGSLTKFDFINNVDKHTLQLTAPEIDNYGFIDLVISKDGTQLYYIFEGAIYSMSTSATALPAAPFKAAAAYYGLAIDPYDGSLIACKAPNFGAAGSIDIMDSNGNVKSTFTTGIGPNGCAFK